jgi:diguanylate cyclase (GGDEF)-like protein
MPGPAPGERMQQSCVLGPIRGEDGRVEALFLTVQDVTDLVQHEQRLVQMNIRDGLTGVFNRRYLDHRLEVEFERFRRYGRRLAVVLVDIDHFKRVNDGLGHPAGDAVLVHLAGALVEAVRRSDVVARYGGEEFCCVLPETDLAGAATVAEKLRAAVQAMRHCWKGAELTLTVSMGVAESRDDMPGPEALVARADAALYAAKEGGRNRVVLDPSSPGSQARAS